MSAALPNPSLPGSERATRHTPRCSRGRVVLESPEELKSTWEHRAWTFGACALLAATLAQGLAQVDSLGSAAGAGAAVLAAYYMADVGTAFYHWGVDNYGDGNTPVFGGQIAAFQVGRDGGRGCAGVCCFGPCFFAWRPRILWNKSHFVWHSYWSEPAL